MRTFKILFIFLFLLFVLTFYVVIKSTSHTRDISIATGSEMGAYYQYALQYKKLLDKEGIRLNIIPTHGSLEAQRMLLNKEVDFAFVQGGTEQLDIVALANIAYEPIWIFHKDQNLTSIKMFQNKKVAVGREKSGIYPVSKELLKTVGLEVNNSNFEKLSSKEAVIKLKHNQIDAMFYVASNKASIVEELMLMKNIHLMDFEKAEAYMQYSLRYGRYYECILLKEGGYDFEKNLPTEDHVLLAKRAIVATLTASNDMVRLLLKTMEKVHKKAGMFHEEGRFPNVLKLKVKQHQASIEYFEKKETFLEKNVNFWLAQTLNGLYTFVLFFFLPLITIFAFIVEVVIPTYAHYSRQRINRWYYIVNEIDTGMDELTEDEVQEKIEFLNNLLIEVRATDDIPAIHMGPFYTLQNQIVSIILDLEKRK